MIVNIHLPVETSVTATSSSLMNNVAATAAVPGPSLAQRLVGLCATDARLTLHALSLATLTSRRNHIDRKVSLLSITCNSAIVAEVPRVEHVDALVVLVVASLLVHGMQLGGKRLSCVVLLFRDAKGTQVLLLVQLVHLLLLEDMLTVDAKDGSDLSEKCFPSSLAICSRA